jgi:hypothetical protein
LAELLRTVPHVPVLRGAVLSGRILCDGNPGEPGVTLSPLMYHYQAAQDGIPGAIVANWVADRI